MSSPNNVVSIHPYFQVHPGQMAAAKALLPAFVEKTTSEPDNLYYEFTINGDLIFCREAYRGGAGALTHLKNVEALLGQLLTLSALSRLELHGPAAELALLKEALAPFNPAWFVSECGVQR